MIIILSSQNLSGLIFFNYRMSDNADGSEDSVQGNSELVNLQKVNATRGVRIQELEEL